MNEEQKLDDQKASEKTKCLMELMSLNKDINNALNAVRSMSKSEYSKAEKQAVDRYGPDLVHAIIKSENEKILVFSVANEHDWPRLPRKFSGRDPWDICKTEKVKKDKKNWLTDWEESQTEQINCEEPPSGQDTSSAMKKPSESILEEYRNTIRVLNDKNDKLAKQLEERTQKLMDALEEKSDAVVDVIRNVLQFLNKKS